MNSLIALVLLGQILGCTLSHHLDLPSDCNSKEAEQYAALVVDYINAHNVHGYKQALNVIKDIVIVKKLTGKAIYMELGLLESKCPVLSPTPIENCIVRTQQQHAVEADCDAKLLSVDGSTKVVAVKCHSSPDSVEDLLKLCPDCPVLLPLNDPAVIEAAEYVLHKHNEQNLGRAYKILEISRGQHHHLPNLVYVEFAIVETNCLVQEAHDGQHDCLPKAAADAHVGFCRATVFRKDAATEKLTDEKFESDCVIFDHKAGESHVHLIEHHLGKNIPSPGHNHTVLNLVHSHNDTNASYESHSAEVLPEVAAPVVKREAPPTEVPHTTHHMHPAKLCPGKIHHFKL
ncbi:alpha-2-HS-glycoprotein [Candoia aspera]|uniref:alpha-2-HS-glycoprotein n=1 Tax=Candoia aspera TaxID=51853 RepID=UPI002FD84D67